MLPPKFRIAFGVFLSLYWLSSFADIPSFTARYTLHQGPVKMGHVKLTLRALPDHQFELKSVTEPDGMLAFVRDDVVTEASRFVFQDRSLLPLQYRYHQREDDDEIRRVELSFDWTQNEVTNTVERHSWKMSVPMNTQDKASIQLALMLKLANGELNPEFPVADGGKLKQYRFEFVAEEPLEINEKAVETIKMIRHKNSKKSDTTFWCAPSLHYLPVRIVKQKKLGAFSMDLDSVVFETPAKATPSQAPAQ